jgi:hypothetical protein
MVHLVSIDVHYGKVVVRQDSRQNGRLVPPFESHGSHRFEAAGQSSI